MTNPPYSDGLQESYDQLPYETRARRKTHPDTLATLATIFGLTPPLVETARILELGCGTGENLLAIACALPESLCIGVDFSAPQIAKAKDLAAAAGISNARFICGDFREIARDQQYDYVVAHGVLSWIPPESHSDLIALCGACLSPGGLLYLSYNAFPGWHHRQIVRDFLLQETADVPGIGAKVTAAREALALLAETVGKVDRAYSRIVADENDNVGKLGDSYVAHDLLGIHNTAFYFADLVHRSAQYDLHYVGEAGFDAMVPDTYPAKIAEALRAISDLHEREQRLDFLINRSFRESVFVKGQQPAKQPDQRSLATLYVASPLERNAERSANPTTIGYQSPGGTEIAVKPGVTEAALDELAACYPEALSLEAILWRVQQASGELLEQDAIMALMSSLFTAYERGLINLHSSVPRVLRTTTAQPAAPALARAQAGRGTRVITVLLENVEITDEDCLAILPHLDGQHDHTRLAMLLSPIGGDLGQRLDVALAKLARIGLLTKPQTI